MVVAFFPRLFPFCFVFFAPFARYSSYPAKFATISKITTGTKVTTIRKFTTQVYYGQQVYYK